MTTYTDRIEKLSYDKKLFLLRSLNIEDEFKSKKVIVYSEDYPETPQFCHFEDVDNGMDMMLRQLRNRKAAEIVVEIIGNNTEQLDKYLSEFE